MVRSARLHGILRAQGTGSGGRIIGTFRSIQASVVGRSMKVTNLPSGRLSVYIERAGGAAHPRVRVRNAALSVTFKTFSLDAASYWVCFGNTLEELIPQDEELLITVDSVSGSTNIRKVIAFEGNINDLPSGITGTPVDGD